MYVVKYLKNTLDLGLLYSAKCDLHLEAYIDSGWSSCVFSCNSLSTYYMFLGSHLVSWKTKEQKTVSTSSAEAENRSMCNANSEVVWLEGLLHDFRQPVNLPIKLYYDNYVAENICTESCFSREDKAFEP